MHSGVTTQVATGRLLAQLAEAVRSGSLTRQQGILRQLSNLSESSLRTGQFESRAPRHRPPRRSGEWTMTFVFRNRLDNDTGRQIFPPVPPANAIDTVAELKAALLVPGTYELAAGTYTANLVATVDNVSIHCLPGVIFNPVTNLDTPWAIRANHFSLTGDWTINASSRLAMEIGLTTNTLQSQQPDVVLIDGGTMTAPAAGCDRVHQLPRLQRHDHELPRGGVLYDYGVRQRSASDLDE